MKTHVFDSLYSQTEKKARSLAGKDGGTFHSVKGKGVYR